MLEKDLLKAAKSYLDYWVSTDVVIHYDDLSNAGRKFIHGRWIMNTKAGRSDLVAYVRVNEVCHVLLLELKTDRGIVSENQIEYMFKFSKMNNVHYVIITEPKQIDQMIEKITNYSANKLKGIDYEP